VVRTLVFVTAFLALGVPAALAAPPADKGKPETPGKSAAAPGQQADKNAAKKCKAMRKSDAAGFASSYGTRSNAFGKCVSAQVKKAEQAEAQEARENAAKQCKKERDQLGIAEFKKTYAPPNHPNGANAFGKCVSQAAKQTQSSS
jgi:hypothetical protein